MYKIYFRQKYSQKIILSLSLFTLFSFISCKDISSKQLFASISSLLMMGGLFVGFFILLYTIKGDSLKIPLITMIVVASLVGANKLSEKYGIYYDKKTILETQKTLDKLSRTVNDHDFTSAVVHEYLKNEKIRDIGERRRHLVKDINANNKTINVTMEAWGIPQGDLEDVAINDISPVITLLYMIVKPNFRAINPVVIKWSCHDKFKNSVFYNVKCDFKKIQVGSYADEEDLQRKIFEILRQEKDGVSIILNSASGARFEDVRN